MRPAPAVSPSAAAARVFSATDQMSVLRRGSSVAQDLAQPAQRLGIVQATATAPRASAEQFDGPEEEGGPVAGQRVTAAQPRSRCGPRPDPAGVGVVRRPAGSRAMRAPALRAGGRVSAVRAAASGGGRTGGMPCWRASQPANPAAGEGHAQSCRTAAASRSSSAASPAAMAGCITGTTGCTSGGCSAARATSPARRAGARAGPP